MTNALATAVFRLGRIALSPVIRMVILYVLVTHVVASASGRNAIL